MEIDLAAADVRLVLELDQGHQRRGGAAHAVEDGDHLRHGGHLDRAGGKNRGDGADSEADQDQEDIVQAGHEERGDDRDRHAERGDLIAAAGGGRGAEQLETDDEADRGDRGSRY